MTKSLASVLLLFLLPIFVPNAVQADEQTDRRIAELEKRINRLPTPIQTHGDNGALVFLFGVFLRSLGTKHRQECVVVVFSRTVFQRHHSRRALGQEFG